MHHRVRLFCDCCSLGTRRRELLRVGLERQGFQVLDGGGNVGQGQRSPAAQIVFLGFDDLSLLQVADLAHGWLRRLLAATIVPRHASPGSQLSLQLRATDGSMHLTVREGKALERAFTVLPELAALLHGQALLVPGTYLRYLADRWWITHVPPQHVVYQYDPERRQLRHLSTGDAAMLSYL